MTRQRFDTADVLRLEVEAEYPPGYLPNLVPNPSGDLGGWGWLSPEANTRVRTHTTGHGLRFETTAGGVHSVSFITEYVRADGVSYGRGAAERIASSGNFVVSPPSGVQAIVHVNFYDAAFGYLGQTGATSGGQTDGGIRALSSGSAPAGVVAYVALEVTLAAAGSGNNLAAGAYVVLDEVAMIAANVPTIMADPGWVDVLGPTHDIAIERAELNLGTLNALIVDSSLDPSQTETLRKGKRVRLVLDSSDEPLFTGEILNAQATYDPAHPNAAKRTRIQLSAVDQAQPLSNVTRSEGVAAVDELRAVLEGCRVPWNVNGDTGQTPDVPVVVARNESASAMDQVAITRDSNHAYAWFSREGVVNVWDAAALTAAAGTPVATLDEDAYNAGGLSIDYDSDRCINHVTLKYLRIDPVTGETEEVTYGPYTDDVSRAKWGTHAAEFTVQGITEDAATLTAYAATILTANATPAVRLNEATVPINTTADVAAWALLDLYDLVTLTNTNAGINEDARITRLSHRIEGGKWTVTYGFTTDGGVAQPQVTPSPTPSGGKTLSQLLRPVGEVTMWYGTTGQIPAPWLRCDGAAIPAEYPDLIALIGANTPNMVDVFPIGAGTKAKGTTGGDPTKTILAANLPSHSHNFSRSTAVGSTGTFPRGTATDGTTTTTGATGTAATPMDVMNPWRALHFIIRAR